MRTNKLECDDSHRAGDCLVSPAARGLRQTGTGSRLRRRNHAAGAPASPRPAIPAKLCPHRTPHRRTCAAGTRCTAAHRALRGTEADRRPANRASRVHARSQSPSTKMSVAVDLRYSFDGAVAAGSAGHVHLAAVPRVTGSNLKVSVQGSRRATAGGRSADGAESQRIGRVSTAVLGDPPRRYTRAIARSGHHGNGRRLGFWLLHDPARWRNKCSKTGFRKTALTALQRGRVDYAP